MTITAYPLAPGEMNATSLQAAVSQRYHVGFDDGIHFYGYCLVPDAAQSGGWHEKTDIAAKDAQIQYASPNIIDRDFVFWPRVTQGDWSGGSNQVTFIAPNQYWDSDLDTRVPGYLTLRSNWARASKAGLTVGSNFQAITFNADFWYTFGEANGNIYSANGATTTTPTAAAVLSLDTDGSLLYAGTAAGLWSTPDGVTWTAITSAINGTAQQWWVVNQGTNGYFAYCQAGTNLLYKVDLTKASPQAAAAQPQVPVGANAINIIDLVEYQTSIAILTVDVRGPGFDVWNFDGNNLTRIIRVEGYIPYGLCQSLGQLYVGAAAVPGGGGVRVGSGSGSGAGRSGGTFVYVAGQTTSPILAQIASGTFTIVARPGLPFPATNQSCLQPRASSQYVYWPIINPSVKGISGAPGVILQYDVLTGAVTKLPDLDTTDFTTSGGSLRAIAVLGANAACCYLNGTTGILQYQQPAFGTVKYQASGKIITSRIDFQTPGVEKRFRRFEAQHAPLPTNTSVKIDAFIDKDPAAYSAGLTPDATLTNSTAGTVSTELFLNNLIGHTVYFVVTLATSDDLATPTINYYFVEATTPWSWEMLLDCTEVRTTLTGEIDSQGVKGKDLAYFFRNAWESPAKLTMYHRNGNSYTVAIESLDLWNPSPHVAQGQQAKDEGYQVKVILRQTL